jgi:predicted O-methyltransferase YrrM
LLTQAKKYNFSINWFTVNIPSWKKNLSRFKKKSGVSYLEIGVYEGRSLIWILENILTHDASKATAIDIFRRDLEDRFIANLKISGFADKVKIIKGCS